MTQRQEQQQQIQQVDRLSRGRRLFCKKPLWTLCILGISISIVLDLSEHVTVYRPYVAELFPSGPVPSDSSLPRTSEENQQNGKISWPSSILSLASSSTFTFSSKARSQSKLDDSTDNGNFRARDCDNKLSPFANQWCHPTNFHYCYHHDAGDWSKCAGNHLFYPPSTAKELYERQYMCLFEPLCWMQLDWQNTDPPPFHPKSCPKVKMETTSSSREHADARLLFYDWSEHDGTMAGVSTVLAEAMSGDPNKGSNGSSSNNNNNSNTVSNLPIDLIHCNTKNSGPASRNFHYNFKLCPNNPPRVQNWSDNPKPEDKENVSKKYHNWAKTDPMASHIHGNIITFLPATYQYFLATNQTIITQFLHRMDMFRCSTKDAQTSIDHLRLMAASGRTGKYQNAPFHIIGSGYVHDVEYIRHYTGIRPFYWPVTLANVLPSTDDHPYRGSKEKHFVWTPYWSAPEELTKTLLRNEYSFIRPSHYEHVDLLQYQGVIMIPYSITSMISLERYEMNIPMFVPTIRFCLESLRCFNDRSATRDPYCKRDFTFAQHPRGVSRSPFDYDPNIRYKQDGVKYRNDEEFWVGFSEVYLWPCVEYFDSWSDLATLLQSKTQKDYQAMSDCMRQANRWRQYEVNTDTCWVLRQLQEETDFIPRVPMGTYEDTLQKLYGINTLFLDE